MGVLFEFQINAITKMVIIFLALMIIGKKTKIPEAEINHKTQIVFDPRMP